MKQFAAVLVVAFLMAGCADQSSREPEAQADRSAPEISGMDDELGVQARQLKKALPEGVVLQFPYHLRGDRILSTEGRKDRRRIGMEYLGSDQEALFGSISKSLEDKGFTMRDRQTRENGNIRAKFGKAKFGTVIVVVTPADGEKHQHPDAVGRVMLDWPIH